jgi:hypothetical protein
MGDGTLRAPDPFPEKTAEQIFDGVRGQWDRVMEKPGVDLTNGEHDTSV